MSWIFSWEMHVCVKPEDLIGNNLHAFFKSLIHFEISCTLWSVWPRREFLALVGSMKARSTNMNCEVTTTVKHDKSEPIVDVTYGEEWLPDGHSLVVMFDTADFLSESDYLNSCWYCGTDPTLILCAKYTKYIVTNIKK